MCRKSLKSGSLKLPGTLWATPGLLRGCFTSTYIYGRNRDKTLKQPQIFRTLCFPHAVTDNLQEKCFTVRTVCELHRLFFLATVWHRSPVRAFTNTIIELSLLTYVLTYLLTPWSRVLLEEVTGSVASQEIPRIFGNRKFIAVFTSARHLSLS
jgi:hypothetical protein